MIETLDRLQYSQDRKGPFKLYIYELNSPYHRGGIWFRNKPKYPVCDGGDMLVFHAKDKRVLYPLEPRQFWEEISVAE